MTEYSTVWLPMSPKVDLIADLGIEETIHLPLFLRGNALTAFKQGRGFEFAPLTLLYGILYGVSDNPPGVDLTTSASYFPKVIEHLVGDLRMPDVETLILTAGAHITQELGSAVSARMLENGLRFAPESSKIRSDCIVALWLAAQEREDQDHLTVLRKIVEMLKEVDYAAIDTAPRKCLAYIARIAIFEVEPNGMQHFLEEKFNSEDLQLVETDRAKISEYMESKHFSWKALALG